MPAGRGGRSEARIRLGAADVLHHSCNAMAARSLRAASRGRVARAVLGPVRRRDVAVPRLVAAQIRKLPSCRTVLASVPALIGDNALVESASLAQCQPDGLIMRALIAAPRCCSTPATTASAISMWAPRSGC